MTYLKSFVNRVLAAYQCFSENEGTQLSAAIAYYLALSLFPLMLVLIALLGWGFQFTASGQNAQQHILAAVAEQASPELSQQLGQAMTSVEKSAKTSGVIGVLALVVTALAMFTQIDYAFDKIWSRASKPAGGWQQWLASLLFVRLKAAVMLMGVGAIVIAVMIASLVWKGVQSNVANVADIGPWFQRVGQPLLHIGVNWLIFAVVYRFIPKAVVSWRAALAGGLMASLLWELGRQLLAAYVVGDKLPSAYGLIGSFMAIMLWTYYAMLVVLFGAAYTRIVHEGPTATAVAEAPTR
jgi:membrane protein